MDDQPLPDDLLPFFERELVLLRQSMGAFAERFPGAAARLGISGERAEDPHVERLLQSAALMNARTQARIDDDYPEFTSAMLERLHPEVLRPFPASSIAQIKAAPDPERGPWTIARGTQFVSRHGRYSFRSAYDVRIAPLAILRARYVPATMAPPGTVLPADTCGLLSIDFAIEGGRAGLARLPDRVRIYLDGKAETAAALADLFLLRAAAAFVEAEGAARWVACERVPTAPVGFDETESLFGRGKERALPLRLLLEYFALPERFHFIDIDVAVLIRAIDAAQSGTTRIALHLAIGGIERDSQLERRLSAVSAANLKLFCTPIVNLFERDAEPIEPKATPGYAVRYPVAPRSVEVGVAQVWAIDRIRLKRDGKHDPEEIEPAHALGHRRYYGAPVWEQLGGALTAHAFEPNEAAFALRKLDGEPVIVEGDQLSVDLVCTNRNLPAGMPIGAEDGDLEAPDTDLQCPVVLLRQPTASLRPPTAEGDWWRLLSHLTPQMCRLDQTGLGDIKRLLRQLASHSGAPARHIDAIVSLSRRSVMLWTTIAGASGFEPGTEITITLDERRFVSDSLSVFIAMMDRFFAGYAYMTTSIQLVALSAVTGATIRRCEPRAGLLSMI
jgi:type VI secretion system protein ImpG